MQHGSSAIRQRRRGTSTIFGRRCELCGARQHGTCARKAGHSSSEDLAAHRCTGVAPSLKLSKRDAWDLNRLRGGVWPRLGRGAVFHSDRAVVALCKFCNTQLVVDHGQAVEHLFACPAHRPPAGMSIQSLWASDEPSLRATLKHCREFAMAPTPIGSAGGAAVAAATSHAVPDAVGA